MSKEDLALTLAERLRAVKAARSSTKLDPGKLAAVRAVKQFQSERLARTHADLMDNPGTRSAVLFFLEELYGAQDMSKRDLDLERIVPTMQRILTYDALRAITDAIVLDALSEELDLAMAAILGASFSQDDYIAAYRQVSTRENRSRQLDLVQEVGTTLCGLVRIPFLSATLMLMRGPARMAGLGELQRFLERGFNTFKHMRQPAEFVKLIVARERELMDNLLSGRAHPLDL